MSARLASWLAEGKLLPTTWPRLPPPAPCSPARYLKTSRPPAVMASQEDPASKWAQKLSSRSAVDTNPESVGAVVRVGDGQGRQELA